MPCVGPQKGKDESENKNKTKLSDPTEGQSRAGPLRTATPLTVCVGFVAMRFAAWNVGWEAGSVNSRL